METESVEVHCWTLQIDKVKMYGWSVKVLYLFISPGRSLILFRVSSIAFRVHFL